MSITKTNLKNDPKRLLNAVDLAAVINARGTTPPRSAQTIRRLMDKGICGVILKHEFDAGGTRISSIEWYDEFRRKVGARRQELRKMERATADRARKAAENVRRRHAHEKRGEGAGART